MDVDEREGWGQEKGVGKGGLYVKEETCCMQEGREAKKEYMRERERCTTTQQQRIYDKQKTNDRSKGNKQHE